MENRIGLRWLVRRERVLYCVRMMLDWLQVPHQWTQRGGTAWKLARELDRFKGRKASEADGLWVLTQVHLWALMHVSPDAEDMAAELREAALIRQGLGARVLGDHLGLRTGAICFVIKAMLEVGELLPVDGGWTIKGLERRYLPMLLRQQAGRHRVRSIRRLWASGWEKGNGKAWVHKKTGREAPGWREAVAMMDAKKETPHAKA